MDLTIVGATGGTGRELTSVAVDRGHRVRGFSRSADELATDEMVTAVEGDVLDAEAVSDAIDGADAVVCLLGRTAGNPGDVIVRPGGLTDRPGTGDYVHGVDLDVTAGPIPRADVADFLLQVAASDAYLRESPVVTSRRDADAGFLWDQVRAVTRRLLAD